MRVVEIDGSHGEGGGQILRSAVALSALTGRGVRIFNIRASRPQPGLAPQHLTAVRGVAAQCGGEMEGAEPGSLEIRFTPHEVSGGSHRLEVGTAGSITLVLQACLLPALRAGDATFLEVSGGTNVRWSPPIDYYVHVLLPLLGRMGVRARLEVLKRGFYPKGGGMATLRVEPPERLSALDLHQRGELRRIGGVCFSRNLPEHVCKRMNHTVRKELIRFPGITMRNEIGEGTSTGAGVMLFAEYENTVLGGDGLGERGMPAEKVAKAAVESIEREIASSATLDVHAADQLLPYMAMADGESRFMVRTVTEHLRTQMWLVPQFLEVSLSSERVDGGNQIRVTPSRT